MRLRETELDRIQCHSCPSITIHAEIVPLQTLMVVLFYMRRSQTFAESEWKLQGTNRAVRVVPVVAEKSQREVAQPKNEFKAQPRTIAQTFSSSSSRLTHSDRWWSSQSKRAAVIRPWLKAQRQSGFSRCCCNRFAWLEIKTAVEKLICSQTELWF